MKNNYLSKVIRIMSIAMLMMVCSINVQASGLMNSNIYTGASNLISDISRAVTILCPVICTVAGIYFAIRRSMADEQDGKMWSKRIGTAIVCGFGGLLISGVITLISSYFSAV